MIDPAYHYFSSDIANSPLCSPACKRPRLESSPSFSELSPLEEQHLTVLDEIEKRFTQSQHVHSPSSRRGVLRVPSTTNVSDSILLTGNYYPELFLDSQEAYFYLPWVCASRFVASGLIMCSRFCPGLTSDSQYLMHIANLL